LVVLAVLAVSVLVVVRKKPRKKGSYTVQGLGAGTGIGIAIGVALYSSGVRWGILIGIVLCAGIGGISGIILDAQAKKSQKET